MRRMRSVRRVAGVQVEGEKRNRKMQVEVRKRKEGRRIGSEDVRLITLQGLLRLSVGGVRIVFIEPAYPFHKLFSLP